MINFLNRRQTGSPYGNDDQGKTPLSQSLGIKKEDFERSQDEFLSIASHELRTPLTAIKGNASLLQQYFWEQLPSDEVRQMIKDIDCASDRMLKLINYFLDTLRLEQKLAKFDLEKFDLVPLVSNTVDAYKQYAKHDVHLMFKGPEGALPQVHADRKWVRHALENLLDNALKFTERGNVTVSLTLDNHHVKIVISDTGQGIPAENREVIFKKFAQTSADILTRDKAVGAGLGLYMARLIMDQMHGSAQLEYSEPGAGSSFSLAIPVAE
jgi:signal transduction histidine kinase